MILPQEDKLTLIPYSALPQRAFIDSYIQEAEMYLTENGILALPFTVDPLVMYWNRDTFNSAGIATYPRTWDQVTALIPKLTVKDQNGNVRKSALAMGTFENVDNARELLGSLLLQTGNPVTAVKSGNLISTIKVDAEANPAPAMQFFMQFIDPSSPNYSWNRSLPDSKSAFLSNSLAIYFGFASELADIRSKNPNLDFDVAALPQLKTGGVKAAYGRMYGFSLVRTSGNMDAAFQIISTLIEPQNLSDLSQTMYLPPVRTSLIAAGTNDPYLTIFYQAALISRAWIDAGLDVSDSILGRMIGSITSGQKTSNQAIGDAGAEYDAALAQAVQ
jgi:ABC-type glycerol-3-phosphate transport system substrate-binding protein